MEVRKYNPENERSKNIFRIGYFPLGSEFDKSYCAAIGVKEVICSYILRNALDLVVFTGRKLEECAEDFNSVLSELEDPNIPKIKLTPERGKWRTVRLNIEGWRFLISCLQLFCFRKRGWENFTRRPELGKSGIVGRQERRSWSDTVQFLQPLTHLYDLTFYLIVSFFAHLKESRLVVKVLRHGRYQNFFNSSIF